MILPTALILAGLIIAALAAMSSYSQKGGPPGLLGGRLQPCPDKPNCVCSETGQVPPIPFSGSPEEAMRRAKEAIVAEGGSIVTETGGYLAAIFKSNIFRFVDDFEIRISATGQVLHVRAGARAGHSDFGVNRKRVEAFRWRFEELSCRGKAE